MEQFRYRQDAFNEIRKKIIIKSLPTLILSSTVGIAIAYYNMNLQLNNIEVIFFAILIAIISMVFGLKRGLTNQKAIISSYLLTIDDHTIKREQFNTTTISMNKDEIKEIIKNKDGSFTIKGNSSSNIIPIPSQLDNYDKLEKLLSEFHAITIQSSEAFIVKYKSLLLVLMLALMAAVYISNDKIIVGFAGTILLVFFVYSIVEIRRNYSIIDNRTKKMMWWFILPTASILANMIRKLFFLD